MRLLKRHFMNEAHIHTPHTHNRFTALLDFVRDYPGEPVPYAYVCYCFIWALMPEIKALID